MDIFSFLPVIIFIYAVATIFNPGNKSPHKRRQGPFQEPNHRKDHGPVQGQTQGKSSRPNPLPQIQTWREKIEELERELFPKEADWKQSPRDPQPTQQTKNEGRLEGYRSKGDQSPEGLGTEGTQGVEGTYGREGIFGVEGTVGTEGTFGSEGTAGTEGTFTKKRSPISQGIPNRSESSRFPTVTQDSLQQGVIWAEILGKPRARNPWGMNRKI